MAGIRVNPAAFGTNPRALALAEVPGIRVIVQPVLVNGDDALPQDFTAHVVFNYVQPGAPNQPIKPDKEAFGRVVQDLRELKSSLHLPADSTTALLQVHPGFVPDPKPLTEKLESSGAETTASTPLTTLAVAGSAQALRVCRHATVERSQYRRRGSSPQECEA